MCQAWLAAYAAWLCRFIEGGLMKSFGVLLITVTEQCDHGMGVWKYYGFDFDCWRIFR